MSRKENHPRFSVRCSDAFAVILSQYPSLETEPVGVIRADGAYVCNWAWVERE
jgi:hypothetical protein